jgi:pSer/pThr/pTyr-binding forkhead associated (FHA) protein
MSGQHARVYHRGEDFFLEDLGSRNGTFVKIRKKTPVPVDTMVRVGGQLFKVLE